jgi:hypothetical protein
MKDYISKFKTGFSMMIEYILNRLNRTNKHNVVPVRVRTRHPVYRNNPYR